MIRYTIRQIFVSVQLLLGISLVAFILISLYPGDPPANLFGRYDQVWRSGQDLADVQSRFGGDTPGPVRYLFWMKEVLTGNLGFSSLSPRPVAEIISEALPVTLGLVAFALAVASLMGIAFGLISAKYHGAILIRSLSAIPLVLTSIPPSSSPSGESISSPFGWDGCRHLGCGHLVVKRLSIWILSAMPSCRRQPWRSRSSPYTCVMRSSRWCTRPRKKRSRPNPLWA